MQYIDSAISFRIPGEKTLEYARFLLIALSSFPFSKIFVAATRKKNRLTMRIVFLIGLFLLTGCQPSPETIKLSGKTMGTSYNVIVVDAKNVGEDELTKAVAETLSRINKHLSNWDENSEVSRFNKASSSTPIKISAPLAEVMDAADNVHRKSRGYFDVTLAPLIDLWGFGPQKNLSVEPSQEDIHSALSQIGQSSLLTLDKTGPFLTKHTPSAQVNLSAIAKGYGVDAVAETLRGFGIKHYMVEIGGDLVTSGTNAKGEAWRIGIEKPDPSGRSIQLVATVSDHGMATSGDYRNYFEKDGIRYSHIIDVKTGRPVTHRTASVTVIANNAMLADAWATALLALGAEEGMKVARENKLAAYFITRKADSEKLDFETTMTPQFTAIAVNQ